MSYREPAGKAAAPAAPEKRCYSSTCLICWRTDCAVHGEENARFLRRCNHEDPDRHRTKRIPCAWCGQDTAH